MFYYLLIKFFKLFTVEDKEDDNEDEDSIGEVRFVPNDKTSRRSLKYSAQIKLTTNLKKITAVLTLNMFRQVSCHHRISSELLFKAIF